MKRLHVYNPEHMKQAVSFAKRTNQWPALREQLLRLVAIARNEFSCVYIAPDFVPNSFYFEVYPDDQVPAGRNNRLWNGGLIYHGQLEDGTKPETFSVTLLPSDSWRIHT